MKISLWEFLILTLMTIYAPPVGVAVWAVVLWQRRKRRV
jgi:hypothetical protein